MGIAAASDDGGLLRNRVARLHIKKRQWAEDGQEVRVAIKMIPRDERETSQLIWDKIRLACEAKFRALEGIR